MKKYIIILILTLISWVNSFSQEIITYKGDTLVALSPEKIRTINAVFVEHGYFKKEIELYKKSFLVDSALISYQDSIIRVKDIIIDKKDLYFTDLVRDLETTISEERKKYRLTRTLLRTTGAVSVIFGIIILCK